jgi:uncharacterized protein (TIGR03000 family)
MEKMYWIYPRRYPYELKRKAATQQTGNRAGRRRRQDNWILEVKMSLYSLTTSRLAALAVAALLVTGKPATADQPQQGPSVPGQAAHFTVTVPADAEVWFDGARTAQAGINREFVSAPLDPGHPYSYRVRVRWSDGGREVDRTRRVTFSAGDHVNLDFTADRVQAQYGYYGPGSADSGAVAQTQRSWNSRPSFTIVPLSGGAERGGFQGVASLGAQDPLRGSGPPGFRYGYEP